MVEAPKMSSSLASLGVSPCSNEYWVAVSSTNRFAVIPWVTRGCLRASAASGEISPAAAHAGFAHMITVAIEMTQLENGNVFFYIQGFFLPRRNRL